MRNTRT